MWSFLKVPLPSTTECSTFWTHYCAIMQIILTFGSDTCSYTEQLAIDYLSRMREYSPEIVQFGKQSDSSTTTHPSKSQKLFLFFFGARFEPTCHLGSNLLLFLCMLKLTNTCKNMTDHLIQRPAAMTYYQKAQLRTSYKYLAKRRIKAIRPALLPYCCASWFLRNCIIAVHDSLGLEKGKIVSTVRYSLGKKRLIRQKERCCLFSYLNCTNKRYYSSSTASQFFMDLCTQLTCSPLSSFGFM